MSTKRKPILESVIMTLWMSTLPALLFEQRVDDLSLIVMAVVLYFTGLIVMWYGWWSKFVE